MQKKKNLNTWLSMAVKMDFTNFLQKSVSKSLSSGCSYLKDKILPPSSPPHSPLSIWYAWPELLQKRICPFSLKKIFFGQRENPITPLQRPAWILTPANSGIFIFFFYHFIIYHFIVFTGSVGPWFFWNAEQCQIDTPVLSLIY